MRGLDTDDLDDEDRVKLSHTLGIATQTLQPNAYISFYSRKFRDSIPDELYIASSVAAQLPWHVRFARLAALNVQAVIEPSWSFPEESLPDPLVERYVADENLLPDIRPAALTQRQPPELTTADEIAEWQQEEYKNARDKLYEREDIILGERPWSRAECPIAAYWLETQSANLDRLVKEMLARAQFFSGYLTRDDNDTAFSILLPGIGMLRSVSRDLQIRAREAIQRGDLAAALRDFDAQLRLAPLIPAKPLLVEALVSIAMHGMALETMQSIVFHSAVTDEQLATLAERLEQPYLFPDFAQTYEMERLVILDYIVNTTARGLSDKTFDNDDYWVRSIVCWDDVLRRINELFDAGIAAAKARDWPAMQQLAQQTVTQPAHYLELQKAYAEKSFWLLPSQRTEVVKYSVPQLMLGAVFNAYNSRLRCEVRHDAVRVMIALERFHRANKTYPAALAELVPAFLPGVPLDPFDDKPLKYVRTRSGGYRAYSVGVNGIDEGGIPMLDKDGDLDSRNSDLGIGSPNEVPPKVNLAW